MAETRCCTSQLYGPHYGIRGSQLSTSSSDRPVPDDSRPSYQSMLKAVIGLFFFAAYEYSSWYRIWWRR